jgi:hypothetical protein
MTWDGKKHMESYMYTMDNVGEEFRRFFEANLFEVGG